MHDFDWTVRHSLIKGTNLQNIHNDNVILIDKIIIQEVELLVKLPIVTWIMNMDVSFG